MAIEISLGLVKVSFARSHLSTVLVFMMENKLNQIETEKTVDAGIVTYLQVLHHLIYMIWIEIV